MFLTKSHTPMAVATLILIMGLLMLFVAGPRANADNADGPIPGSFGNVSQTHTGWSWSGSGTNGQINVFLGSTLAGNVFEIEVFVEPDTSTAAVLQGDHKPAHTQVMGNSGAFPTGELLTFGFTTTKNLNTSSSKVGIHLMGRDSNGDETRLGTSNAPVNSNLLVAPAAPASLVYAPALAAEPWPTPTPTPVPTPTPTPVPPPTGDWAPGSGLILAMILAGLLLVVAGGVYLTQSHGVKE
jgi:hypothetical protein